MKRFLPIAILFIISLVLIPPVIAQSPTSVIVVDPIEAFQTPTKTRPEKNNKMSESAVKEKMQKRKDEFKEKLQSFKDERRKVLIQKLDEKMSAINLQATDRMLSVLEKIEGILDKLSQKVDVHTQEGKDTANAKLAMTNAQSAVETAKAAISQQASKDYTPQITDEETVKNVVGSSISNLRADLSAVHKQIIDAKQAVMKVATEVVKLRGQKIETTQTPIISQ